MHNFGCFSALFSWTLTFLLWLQCRVSFPLLLHNLIKGEFHKHDLPLSWCVKLYVCPGCSQDILLDLCLGVTPGDDQGTISMAGDQNWSQHHTRQHFTPCFNLLKITFSNPIVSNSNHFLLL